LPAIVTTVNDATTVDSARAREFWTAGYIAGVPVLPRQQALKVGEQVLQLVQTPGPCDADEHGERDDRHCRHLDSQVVLDLCTEPALLAVIRAILGNDLVLLLSQVWIKPPITEVPPHQDAAYWPMHPPVGLSAWIALTDTSVSSGCLDIFPGSQRTLVQHDISAGPEFKSKAIAAEGAQLPLPIEMQAGNAVLFDVATMHASHPNNSDHPRVAVSATFSVPMVTFRRDWCFKGHRVVLASGTDRFELNRSVSLQDLRIEQGSGR
jgi:ectoine hydroxylase-related dioxygenase (phytanoyl-CoA dioxygenase family)